MPNLDPPITTVAAATGYRQRIVDALTPGSKFTPLMTLYLTDNMASDEVNRASDSSAVFACKLYPAGATTNSDSGVSTIDAIDKVLERMTLREIPLLVHGEVTDADIDIFDREKVFVDRVLQPLRQRFPDLRIVLEHVSTAYGVQFVQDQASNVGATVTPQHLLLNRNDLLVGGLRPHHYCLPVLKTEQDRKAIVDAATSGDPRFFLGTDSAPHALGAKESACGCAGIYSAPVAMELYAQVFDGADALDHLESFASLNGADFYRLPRNTDSITLIRTAQVVADSYPYGDDRIVPLAAGNELDWSVIDE